MPACKYMLVLALFACSTPGNEPPTDWGWTDVPDGATSGTDSGTDGEDGDTIVPQDVFQLGLNETGESAPQYFEIVSEGDKVPIELGPQGAWMLVAAIKTNLYPGVKKAKVSIKLKAPDEFVYGKATFKKKAIYASSDGFSYMMNIWLVITNKKDDATGKFLWQDQEATFSISLESSDGEYHEDQVHVVMYKETPTE